MERRCSLNLVIRDSHSCATLLRCRLSTMIVIIVNNFEDELRGVIRRKGNGYLQMAQKPSEYELVDIHDCNNYGSSAEDVGYVQTRSLNLKNAISKNKLMAFQNQGFLCGQRQEYWYSPQYLSVMLLEACFSPHYGLLYNLSEVDLCRKDLLWLHSVWVE